MALWVGVKKLHAGHGWRRRRMGKGSMNSSKGYLEKRVFLMMQMPTLGPMISLDQGSHFSGDSPGLAVWHTCHRWNSTVFLGEGEGTRSLSQGT